MAKIRIPVELYKGRDAIPLKKLGDVAVETEKFMTMLGEDIHLEAAQVEGEWLATNIKGGSLTFDLERVGVSESHANIFVHNFSQIIKDPLGKNNGHISRKTRKQFANIVKSLDSGDSVRFGVYETGKSEPIYFPLSKETSIEIMKSVEEQIEFYGSIQGIIEDEKLIPPHFFHIRELSTGRRIKCYYKEDLFDKIHEITKQIKRVIFISGRITVNQYDEKIEYMKLDKAEDIEVAEEYLSGDLEKFIGSAPTLLKGKSLQDWIDEVRNHES